jgi:hypothetical protein
VSYNSEKLPSAGFPQSLRRIAIETLAHNLAALPFLIGDFVEPSLKTVSIRIGKHPRTDL